MSEGIGKYVLLCFLVAALYAVPDRFKWVPLVALLIVTFVLLPVRAKQASGRQR